MALFVSFLFFFFFLFHFFLNHVIIDLGTKSCMQLVLWHIKNLNSTTTKGNNKIQTKRAKTLQAESSKPCRIAIDD